MSEGRAHRKGRPSPVSDADIATWRNLREVRNLSYPEIELATGVPADTIRYHLTRKLRKSPRESQPRGA